METIRQDLKYAVRTLRKSPGFTAAAILALALGIGANTAIFSVIHAVLVNSRPLGALREPDRLVMIWEKNPALPGFIAARVTVCLKNYLAWKQQARSFEGMALYGTANFTLTARGDGGNLKPELVSGAFALTRLMASLVFGVSATDPFTFAAVALLLIAVAVAASYLPARRGARIDPMEALRAE